MIDVLQGILSMDEELEPAEKQKRGADSQAQRLVNLALESGAEFFHNAELEAYATIPINGHKETWPLRGKVFRNWLRRLLYERENKAPGAQAVQDAVEALEAMALFEGKKREVYTRIAGHDGKIYLDLANDHWEVVEISASGWQVVSNLSVRFRRSKGMLALPYPERGGSIQELALFLNIESESLFMLVVGWLIMALRPTGPYPILVLQGEQGSAKSTTARVLRELIDPCAAPLRTIPREERDLAITASNNWVIALDNLSSIPPWLSDALCRLATGGGFATRKLYTDDEETIFSFCRPVVVNGIDEIVSRHDLLDRSLIVNLPPIAETKRIDEEVFWWEFEKVRPKILGALLDAVSVGLQNIASVRLDRYPRMADFAKWVTACEPVLPWEAGEFSEAYAESRRDAIDLALETDLVAVAVKALLEERESWEGTATELLATLDELITDQARKSKFWPKTARGLSNSLRRAASFLRQTGIEVEFFRESKITRKRLIRLSKQTTVQNVQNVQESPETQENQGLVDWTMIGRKNLSSVQNCNLKNPETQENQGLDDTLDGMDANDFQPSNPEALKNKALDDMDGMDAKIQSKSIVCPTCSMRSGEKRKKQPHVIKPSQEWPGWLEVICEVCGGKRYIKEGDVKDGQA